MASDVDDDKVLPVPVFIKGPPHTDARPNSSLLQDGNLSPRVARCCCCCSPVGEAPPLIALCHTTCQ